MTNKVSKSKSAVRAAREAVKASQKEVLERAARNANDLAVFFSSRERLDAVDDWLETKTASLREQAEGKRSEHRRAAGLAVVALRERGEMVREIARLTGVNEKALRELIRFAESDATEAAGAGQEKSADIAREQAGARAGAEAAGVAAMARPVGPVVGAPDEALSATG
jgi:hypothetical protein